MNRMHTLRLAVVFLGVAVGSLWYLLPTADPVGHWLIFAAAVAAGELILLDSLSGRTIPTSIGVLAAFALLGHPPTTVAAVAALGWAGACAFRLFRGEDLDLPAFLYRTSGALAMVGGVALGSRIAPQVTVGGAGVHVPVGAIVAVTVMLVLGKPIWDAISREHRAVRSSVFLETLEETWAANVTLASSAALTAVAYGVLGPGALLLMLLPVVAVRGGLHRYIDIRRTYDQTIVAMSHMTELTGHIRPGHGLRVRALAIDVGRQLGLTEHDLEILERACYLHEIGRIATDDPDYAAPDAEVALVSARIVAEAGSMPRVTQVISRHRDPYRRPGTGDDVTLPMASRIVRTLCEFDRLAGDEVGGEVWTALDHLHRAMAYEHDPAVVNALVQVVEDRRLVA